MMILGCNKRDYFLFGQKYEGGAGTLDLFYIEQLQQRNYSTFFNKIYSSSDKVYPNEDCDDFQKFAYDDLSPNVVRLLLQRDDEEKNLLHYATGYNLPIIIDFLNRKTKLSFLSTDRKGMIPAHYAARCDSLESLKLIFELSDKETRQSMLMSKDNQKKCILHHAAEPSGVSPEHKEDMLKWIVEQIAKSFLSEESTQLNNIVGADGSNNQVEEHTKSILNFKKKFSSFLDWEDSSGSTPLLILIKSGHISAARFFISVGASPNKPFKIFHGMPLSGPMVALVQRTPLRDIEFDLLNEMTLNTRGFAADGGKDVLGGTLLYLASIYNPNISKDRSMEVANVMSVLLAEGATHMTLKDFINLHTLSLLESVTKIVLNKANSAVQSQFGIDLPDPNSYIKFIENIPGEKKELFKRVLSVKANLQHLRGRQIASLSDLSDFEEVVYNSMPPRKNDQRGRPINTCLNFLTPNTYKWDKEIDFRGCSFCNCMPYQTDQELRRDYFEMMEQHPDVSQMFQFRSEQMKLQARREMILTEYEVKRQAYEDDYKLFKKYLRSFKSNLRPIPNKGLNLPSGLIVNLKEIEHAKFELQSLGSKLINLEELSLAKKYQDCIKRTFQELSLSQAISFKYTGDPDDESYNFLWSTKDEIQDLIKSLFDIENPELKCVLNQCQAVVNSLLSSLEACSKIIYKLIVFTSLPDVLEIMAELDQAKKKSIDKERRNASQLVFEQYSRMLESKWYRINKSTFHCKTKCTDFCNGHALLCCLPSCFFGVFQECCKCVRTALHLPRCKNILRYFSESEIDLTWKFEPNLDESTVEEVGAITEEIESTVEEVESTAEEVGAITEEVESTAEDDIIGQNNPNTLLAGSAVSCANSKYKSSKIESQHLQKNFDSLMDKRDRLLAYMRDLVIPDTRHSDGGFFTNCFNVITTQPIQQPNLAVIDPNRAGSSTNTAVHNELDDPNTPVHDGLRDTATFYEDTGAGVGNYF